ncbi:hypothetical protein ES703_81082 [subsurface metagenome]
MPLNNPTPGESPTSGSYTGDNTANRFIPHGLKTTPKLIFIMQSNEPNISHILGAMAAMEYHFAASDGRYTVTIPDSTNFHVGDAANYSLSKNATGETYYWVACP